MFGVTGHTIVKQTMINWSRTHSMRRIFASVLVDERFEFSTTVRNESGIESSQNSINSIKMAYTSYESVKSSDFSSNTPIIIMHGLLGSKNNWNSLSKVIHNRTKRKVIAVDARNHGDSPHTHEISYTLMADDVRQLMLDLKAPKATVVGHSMGGRTMMLFALKYPELVEQLVVADISPVRDSPNMKVMPTYLRALNEVHLEPNQPISIARRNADKQLASLVEDKVLRQFFLANLVETKEGTFHWKMNVEALTASFSELASFPSVHGSFNGPTCFIAGGKSDFIKKEDHEQIKQFFPKAVFKYIADAGHWLHAEKPAEFLEIFCNFFNERK